AGLTGHRRSRAEDQRGREPCETRSIHAGRRGEPGGEPTMTTAAHLWAIGYDDVARAARVRDEIIELGWGAGKAGESFIRDDVAVVARHPDGSFTFDRKPFPGLANILVCTGAGFLAGLVLAAPLTGATVGALLGSAGTAAGIDAGI